ncbi:MAG: YhcH/YjgK/YiaL family protein [Verrucomicrobiae bacterium]|nr:YhcH/YjgK/YiaL family protein [Verrucomicrobiae bacterium]
MILDTLGQWSRYAGLHPHLTSAFRFLQNLATSLDEGRWAIAGDECFALIQKYTTRPVRDAQLETHDQYADLQYLHQGAEQMLWVPRSELASPTRPYDPQRDATVYATPDRATRFTVTQGQFTIFYPSDAHATGIVLNQPAPVTKVVIKLRLPTP